MAEAIKVPVDVEPDGEAELQRMAGALDKVTGKLRALDMQGKKLNAGKLRAFGSELQRTNLRTSALAKTAGPAGLGSSVLGSFGLFSMGAAGAVLAVGSVISKVLDLGAALARMGVEGAVSFGRFAIQTGQFRENTLTTLSVLLKSKEAANKLYKEAVKFAAVTPFNTQEVVQGYKGLIAKGFKPEELKRVFTAVGDLAAANPDDPTAMTRLVYAMGQIRSAGKLMGQDLNQVLGAGLSRDTVAKKIAEVMGSTVEEAKKAMSSGKVSGDVAIEAIVKAMEEDFGGTMQALSKTLTGLWSTLVSKPAELIDKALDPKGEGKFAGGIMGFYDSIKSIVGDLGGAFFEKDGETLTGTGKEVVDTINAMGNALKEVVGVGRAFFEGFFEGLMENRDGTDSLRDAMGNLDLEKMGEEARTFGRDVASIANAVAGVSGALLKLSENETAMLGLRVVFAVIAGALWGIATPAWMAASAFHAMAAAIDTVAGALKSLRGEMGGETLQPFGGSAANPWGMNLAGAPEGRLLPAVTSSTSSPVASATAGGDEGTTNHNSVSISVSGGMFPEEIAQLVRTQVRRAMDEL